METKQYVGLHIERSLYLPGCLEHCCLCSPASIGFLETVWSGVEDRLSPEPWQFES